MRTRRIHEPPAGILKPDTLYDYLHGQERDMDAINLADAKARLSELVDRVEAGDSIDITRRGKRSEEHTSELQSLMRISYAVFCLKKKKQNNKRTYSKH